jgi:hypothetical protein
VAVGKTRFSFCDKPGLSCKRGAQESKKPGFYHFSDKLLEKSGFLALIMGVFVEEKSDY